MGRFQNDQTDQMTQSTLFGIEGLVLDVLDRHWDGLTLRQIAEQIDVRSSSVSPCLQWLSAKRLIRDSGERRRDGSGRLAVVWKTVK